MRASQRRSRLVGIGAAGMLAVSGTASIEGSAVVATGRLRCRTRYLIRFDRPTERVTVDSRLVPAGSDGWLDSLPVPQSRSESQDPAGNRVERLAFAEPLDRLELVAVLAIPLMTHAGSEPSDPGAGAAPESWERVVSLARRHAGSGTSTDRPNGAGRCLDRAQALLADLAPEGIAGRLACGYLLGNGEPHAWVEVPTRAGCWVGIDPTLGDWTGDRHVRLAAGATPADIALVSGRVWPDDVVQTMSFRITTEPLPRP